MGDKKEQNFSVRERLERDKEEKIGQAESKNLLPRLGKFNMQFFAGDGDDKGNGLTKMQKVILAVLTLVAIGIVLTFIEFKPKSTNEMSSTLTPVVQTISTSKQDKDQYDSDLEKRLVEILKQIEGVGDVDVMVTLGGTTEKVLAEEKSVNNEKTEEKDSTGGTRSTNKENTQNKVVMTQGNTPYVVKERMPEISGVLVVAEGGDDSYIKSAIIESVSSLLGIPVHKVSVFKMGKN